MVQLIDRIPARPPCVSPRSLSLFFARSFLCLEICLPLAIPRRPEDDFITRVKTHSLRALCPPLYFFVGGRLFDTWRIYCCTMRLPCGVRRRTILGT